MGCGYKQNALITQSKVKLIIQAYWVAKQTYKIWLFEKENSNELTSADQVGKLVPESVKMVWNLEDLGAAENNIYQPTQ